MFENLIHVQKISIFVQCWPTTWLVIIDTHKRPVKQRLLNFKYLKSFHVCDQQPRWNNLFDCVRKKSNLLYYPEQNCVNNFRLNFAKQRNQLRDVMTYSDPFSISLTNLYSLGVEFSTCPYTVAMASVHTCVIIGKKQILSMKIRVRIYFKK